MIDGMIDGCMQRWMIDRWKRMHGWMKGRQVDNRLMMVEEGVCTYWLVLKWYKGTKS